MARCAFCPTEATKLSGEHIWDDWLNRELPTKRFRMRQQRGTAEPLREYDARTLKEKLPVVCERCNNTWMSDISREVKQGFSAAIVDGYKLSVLPSGIALLSAFTFMKAVVADHASQRENDEAFFSTAARERLRKSRAIPAEVQMWVASFYGAHAYSGKFVPAILTADPGPLFGVQFFTFTYVVGHVVLQLLTPRWKDVRLRGQLLPVIKPDAYWNPVAVRFSPREGLNLSWPPPKIIGDDVIHGFIDRFKAPINIRIA